MDYINVLPGYKPLLVGAKCNVLYRKGSLYYSDSLSKTPVLICKIKTGIPRRFLSYFRIFERILRLAPRGAVVLDDKTILVSCQGGVQRVDLQQRSSIVEHQYRNGMSNPLCFGVIENIPGFDDCIAYGEYWGNPEKSTVAIYVRNKRTGSWSQAYSFGERQILHIHAVIPDPFRNGVLILTGDSNEESGIWFATNNFTNVVPILTGRQGFRSCVAFPLAHGILFATDSPLEKNAICIATQGVDGWSVERLYDLPGPCIYGVKFGKHFLLSTSVEPDSRIKGIGYLFTYRLGEGVEDRMCRVLLGDQEDGFVTIATFKKDWLPMGLCQFGTVQFPAGEMDEHMVIYPNGVLRHDGNTLILNKQKHQHNINQSEKCTNLNQ